MKYDLVYKTATTPYFPICLMGSNYSRNFKTLSGVDKPAEPVVAVIDHGTVSWFFPFSLRKLAALVVSRIVTSLTLVGNIKRQEKILSSQLVKLTNFNLRRFYKGKTLTPVGRRYLERLFEVYHKYAYFVDAPGFLFQLYYIEVLKAKLFKHWRSDSRKQKEIKFNLLLSSVQLTNYEKYLSDLIRGATSGRINKPRLVKKYFWLVHDYLGDIIDEKYLTAQLKEIKSEVDEYRSQLQAARRRISEINKITAALPVGLRREMNNIHQLMYLYNERKKEVINKVNIFIRQLVAWRYPHYSLSQLRKIYQLAPKEIISLLAGDKILNWPQRDKSAVYLMADGQISSGGRKYLLLLKDTVSKALKGLPASPGKAVGQASIILNISHIPKFKKGTILVAPFTNVNYLPIMRAAKAIITETGGLTSHAAIVARELNKPCIVGVKNLIASLRDGDRIEVNADKGLIKKL
jgi:phosphohistidine swiveling domain-containing protein